MSKRKKSHDSKLQKHKFKPKITRIKLNPKETVLACCTYSGPSSRN
ncbi:MAG: hypothetical protein KKH94_10830 [Candidatus Omnitrophica bacterium]|nr:hypothetical protein [Candidatus Omnitrophota bacterium]